MLDGIERLRQISSQDFAVFGIQNLAYVKEIVVNEETRFAIHAADGTIVAIAPDRALADVTIRQNDLEPVSVH